MLLAVLLAAGLEVATPQQRNYTVVHAFDVPPVRAPYASLLRASDGAFYGTLTGGGPAAATGGGPPGSGALVRYTPKASRALTMTVVHAFNGADGSTPYAALIEGPGGALYGTTAYGGATGQGTIFRYQLSTSTLTTLYSFGANPAFPYGTLLLGADGALYGAAGRYGSMGALFRFDLSSSTFTILHAFDSQSGGWPAAGVVQTADGVLYGMTGSMGGPGAIYRYDPATSSFTVVHNFNVASGQNPYASLIQGADGRLYGTTTSGGANGRGVIFSFDPATAAYTVLHHFTGTEGAYPHAPLHQGADSALYGTTVHGGIAGGGTLYKFDLSTATLTTLEHFDGEHGLSPYGGVIAAGDGTLLGTASAGGWGLGTIFRYDPTTTTVRTEHRLAGRDGAIPRGALTDGGDGVLYGTTADGGMGGGGTLFRYRMVDGDVATLHHFLAAEGTRPLAGVIRAADGHLYGTTSAGGFNGTGTLFRYDVPAATLTSLSSFGLSVDGSAAALVQTSDGLLYGTTNSYDSSTNFGTVFRFEIPTATLTTIYWFFSPTNENAAALIQASDGALYGTSHDRIGLGSLFRLNPSTFPATVVRLNQTLRSAYGAVLQAADGFLYGTTAEGGTTNEGSLFRYELGTGAFVTVHSFARPMGAVPIAALVQGADGALYGTTLRGGTSDEGTVFRFDPVTLDVTTLHSFTGADGARPEAALVVGTDSALYGTTVSGGPLGGGVVFRLQSPITSTGTPR